MDAALLQHYLGETAHLEPVDRVADAAVIVVLGCAVTQHMEDESRDIIEYLQQTKRPGVQVVVLGCIAKARPEFHTVNPARVLRFPAPRLEAGQPADLVLFDLDDGFHMHRTVVAGE